MQKKRLATNTLSSLILQITTVICGFILPRLILSHFGSETNGLVNSISQFLQIIAFLELGVGAVVQSALYKPLAEKASDSISAIIVSANRFFRRLAYILLVYVVFLMLSYPYIAEQSVDHLSTAALIAAMSISSFAQYYFGVVDRLLLTADQRGYVQYSAQTITLILNTVASIILIQAGASIQIVKLSTSLIFLLRPIALRVYVNKRYAINRSIQYEGEPIKQKWNGIAQHIAAVVLDRTDMVVLTAFRPFSDVSVYSVYLLVAHGVKQLFMSMTNGLQAMVGRLWAKQDNNELRRVFGWIEWVIHTGTVFVFGCASVLIVPFVTVYTHGIGDANYNQPVLAALLLCAQAASCLRLPNNIMILAGGHYRQTQRYYIIAALMNIIVSVVTVRRWGLNGVAFGSLIAMMYHAVWMSIYNSKNLLKWPLKSIAKQLLADVIIVLIGVAVSRLLHMKAVSYGAWLVLALKTAAIWALVILLVNYILYRQRVLAILRLGAKALSKLRK